MEKGANGSLKEKIKELLRLNSTPPEIALGVAIGVFICVLPFYGFHTLLVVLLALLIPRANKIAMLAGTNFSLPPTVPFITWAGYEIGRAVLQRNYPPLDFQYFRHFDFKNIGDFYFPLLVGSVLLGAACSIVFYFITLVWFQQREKQRRR